MGNKPAELPLAVERLVQVESRFRVYSLGCFPLYYQSLRRGPSQAFERCRRFGFRVQCSLLKLREERRLGLAG